MDLNQALETMKFDVRMRDWNVKQGTIKKEDVQKHVASLPDHAGSAEPVTLEDREDFS